MKKKFKVGQKVIWKCTEFDGSSSTEAVITEVHTDHCIARSADNMTLWIDKDTEYMFFIENEFLEMMKKSTWLGERI